MEVRRVSNRRKLGRALAAARRAQNLSRLQLAADLRYGKKRSNWNAPLVSRIESGQSAPSWQYLWGAVNRLDLVIVVVPESVLKE